MSDVVIEQKVRGGPLGEESHPSRRVELSGYSNSRFRAESNFAQGADSESKHSRAVFVLLQVGPDKAWTAVSVEEAEAMILILQAAINDSQTILKD